KSIPTSAVVPTRNRAAVLGRTLESLSAQEIVPAELIVIDGSTDTGSKQVVEQYARQWSSHSTVVWQAAAQLGAAAQRNQGVGISSQPFIWFFDDDILFEP